MICVLAGNFFQAAPYATLSSLHAGCYQYKKSNGDGRMLFI